MYINNDFIGRVRVTGHAMDRYNELFPHPGPIEPILKRAVPYGAQKHGETLLKDGSIAFAVSRDKSVMTTLTLDMAIVNMQTRDVDMRNVEPTKPAVPARAPIPPRKPPVSTLDKPHPNQKAQAAKSGAFANSLFSKSDQELTDMLYTAVGSQKQAIDQMLALRSKLTKYKQHAETMHLERIAAVTAMVHFLPPDQKEAFYQEIKETQAWLREFIYGEKPDQGAGDSDQGATAEGPSQPEDRGDDPKDHSRTV